MTKEQIFDKISSYFVNEWEIPQEKITMDALFFDDLNADSLDMVDLISAIEDEFDISVEDEDVEQIRTVGDAVNYIYDALA